MAAIKVAIIGAGRIAGGYDEGREDGRILSHAGAYRAHGGFEITACIDPNADRRAEFMTAWDIPIGYDDIEDWLSDEPRAEIVSLCTPDETHAPLLRRLSETPVHTIWAEKPLTTEPGEARALAQLLEQKGKAVAVNYLRRWDRSMERLRAEFVDGTAGALQSAVAYYGKGLLHNGSHALDLLRFLFGPLHAVAARRPLAEASSDATLHCWLETADRRPIQLVGVDESHFTLFEMTIITTKGRIDINDSGFTLLRRTVESDQIFDGYRRLGRADASETELGTAMLRAATNLHQAVTDGEPLACNAAEAAETLALCAELRALAACAPEPAS